MYFGSDGFASAEHVSRPDVGGYPVARRNGEATEEEQKPLAGAGRSRAKLEVKTGFRRAGTLAEAQCKPGQAMQAAKAARTEREGSDGFASAEHVSRPDIGQICHSGPPHPVGDTAVHVRSAARDEVPSEHYGSYEKSKHVAAGY
jgi:hypothetical protein